MRAANDSGVFEGGFQSPVHDSQAIFTAVMNALARPGLVQPVGANARPPQPLNGVAGALALCLFDSDTSILIDKAQLATVGKWLQFHTGTAFAARPAKADFAIITDVGGMDVLQVLALGSQEYPDRSTTAIVQVPGFDVQPRWSLSGPGIDGSLAFSPDGVSDNFLDQWERKHALFPRGIDIVFAAPDGLAALPRSTKATRIGIN